MAAVVQLRLAVASAPGVSPGEAAVSFDIKLEISMSADKDRAIRRVKQKRAKDNKKAARQQYEAAAAAPATAKAPKQKAA
jgi:hypothetical protein